MGESREEFISGVRRRTRNTERALRDLSREDVEFMAAAQMALLGYFHGLMVGVWGEESADRILKTVVNEILGPESTTRLNGVSTQVMQGIAARDQQRN